MIDTTCGYRAGGDATGADIPSHLASQRPSRQNERVTLTYNTSSAGTQRYHREKMWDGENT